jgi:hypothetical protein
LPRKSKFLGFKNHSETLSLITKLLNRATLYRRKNEALEKCIATPKEFQQLPNATINFVASENFAFAKKHFWVKNYRRHRFNAAHKP